MNCLKNFVEKKLVFHTRNYAISFFDLVSPQGICEITKTPKIHCSYRLWSPLFAKYDPGTYGIRSSFPVDLKFIQRDLKPIKNKKCLREL